MVILLPGVYPQKWYRSGEIETGVHQFLVQGGEKHDGAATNKQPPPIA
jgi:hypothetical protein